MAESQSKTEPKPPNTQRLPGFTEPLNAVLDVSSHDDRRCLRLVDTKGLMVTRVNSQLHWIPPTFDRDGSEL
ncbi:hypothetical protein VTN31DRAFT_2862 [Thermomyces dupontii]|uniref:uncharacterized protein n=1 Tax=Talaromyces thermophilus TaxID=28565 RepID=UPI003743183D